MPSIVSQIRDRTGLRLNTVLNHFDRIPAPFPVSFLFFSVGVLLFVGDLMSISSCCRLLLCCQFAEQL